MFRPFNGYIQVWYKNFNLLPNLKMTVEWSKHHSFIALIFITKSISKNLLRTSLYAKRQIIVTASWFVPSQWLVLMKLLQCWPTVVGTLKLYHLSPWVPLINVGKYRVFSNKKGKKSPDYQHWKWGKGRTCFVSHLFCLGLWVWQKLGLI